MNKVLWGFLNLIMGGVGIYLILVPLDYFVHLIGITLVGIDFYSFYELGQEGNNKNGL